MPSVKVKAALAEVSLCLAPYALEVFPDKHDPHPVT